MKASGDKKNNDMANRLRAFRLKLGLRQDKAALEFNIPFSTYKRYESGTNNPSSEAVAGMMRAGLNTNWLLTGEGEMLLADQQAQADERPRLTKPEIKNIKNEVFGGSPARFPKNEQFEAMLKRVAEASQATVRVSKEFDFALPVEWTSLIQELMALHGLTEAGAKRVIEELKRQA